MPRKLSLFTLLSLGCGATQPPPAPATVSAQAAGASTAESVSDQLPRDARYADLVQRASELEAVVHDTLECLLLETAGGFRLRSELAAAVRPLPTPPDDLDEALKSSEHVELLSAWGRHGDGNGKLALAGFTRSAVRGEAVAWLLTDRGIALRTPSGSAGAPLDGLDLPAALAALASLDPNRQATVFLAAEGGRPLAELYRALDALGQQGAQVTLAAPLAPNTALPLPARAAARPSRCAEGLSDTTADEGSLPTSELLAGVAQLKQQAPECLSHGDARGAAGGRLSLAFRIGEDGRVQEACISQAELDDDAVLACVKELAGQLRFAAPAPRGVVDVELPIVLKGSSLPAQRAVCSPADA
jgi:hypothetical protein